MKTIQVSDEDYDFLVELVNNLKTQYNRATADPIYCVQERIKEPRPDEYSSDGTFYVERVSGDCDQYDSLIEMYRNLLENGHTKDEIRGEYDVINYTEEWHTVQACFTEQGAQWFINRKKHDYKKLQIYAESLYHNYEMRTLRNILLKLEL
jgi:hypothetical protein